jgi:hydroxymethylpyrimidine/phosphomethylpyrimidine kinase
MVSSTEIIHIIAEKLKQYAPKNLVIDPVMVSTSGCQLITPRACSALRTELLPLADVVTPNLPEAEVLCGFPVHTESQMEHAAQEIGETLHAAVLVKGGHLAKDAADCLYDHGTLSWYRSKRVANPNTHGTGCTLSSAIACNLAAGKPLQQSISDAKDYLTGALQAMLNLGRGSGPLDHTYWLEICRENQ